ncbi:MULTISPECIES: hypothetical protein [Pseudomonas]|jgi:hypothetical protein|uniref:Uncharacterized protein n=1 Tax=Pseudomonas canadensis TaxID=915099 RepID=A0ABZ1A6Z1_9PSED|nr:MULTISPECIES: hypothetical protein [Pseudomonas]MDY0937410.1 hypothetical protein [Pseudomonas viridiflava]MDY1014933.1 hypothetical protein [Pseudomonas viridiflava]WRI25170.1 hypothetical protein SPL95_02260 [Pseudomonas canadensis]
MKKTEESNVQQSAKLAKGAMDQRSNVIGFAQFKERQATEEYRKALEMVVANAQKADW